MNRREVGRKPITVQLLAALLVLAMVLGMIPAALAAEQTSASGDVLAKIVSSTASDDTYGNDANKQGAGAWDGDPSTFWHTSANVAGVNHWIDLVLEKPSTVAGITYLPRQDHTNGRISTCELWVSEDGTKYEKVGEFGPWDSDTLLKTCEFDQTYQNITHVKLVALNCHAGLGGSYAGAAEIQVVSEFVPEGELIFSNDFDAADAEGLPALAFYDGQYYTYDQKSEIVAEDGRGKVWQIGSGNGRAYGFVYDETLCGDQTLRFDMKRADASNDNSVYINIRQDVAGNEDYGYTLGVKNDSVSLSEGYETENHWNHTDESLTIQLDEALGTDWHSYEFSVKGYTLTLKIDGKKVGTWTDTQEHRKMGGFSFWGWKNTAYIDNISYYGSEEVYEPDNGRIEINYETLDIDLTHAPEMGVPLHVVTYLPVAKSHGGQFPAYYTEPSNSGKVTWVSSNRDVATIDAEGMIHPVANGTTTITATHSDYEGMEAQCTVNVYTTTYGKTLEVGPGKQYATIEAARDAIRQMSAEEKEGGVKILVYDGEYYVDEPIRFTKEDSGTKDSPILYQAAPGANPVITGGKQIENWKKQTEDIPGASELAQGNLYVADIETGWRFHDLYVDGVRQQVSRRDNTDSLDTSTSFGGGLATDPEMGTKVQFRPGELDGLDGSEDIEVTILPQVYWNTIAVVTGIDSETNTAWIQSKIPSAWGDWGKYNILNALKYLDEPGEWCVDSKAGKVYFWPIDESVMTEGKIVAPKPYRLLELMGDLSAIEADTGNVTGVGDVIKEEDLVQYLTFDGISFQYTDRMPENLIPSDWALRNSEHPDAALYLDGTAHCRIINSEIAHSGTYGIMVNHYGQYNEINYNKMHDLGAGGVELFGYGVGTVDVNHHNLVLGNTIMNMGVAPYQHCGGVSVFGSGSNTFAYNLVGGTSYAAFSIVGTDQNSVSAVESQRNCRAAFDTYGNGNSQYLIRFDDLMKNVPKENQGTRPDGTAYGKAEDFLSIAALNGTYQHSNKNAVEYNFVQDYCMRMNDGGGLYSWYSGYGNLYANNLLTERRTDPSWAFYALYLDNSSTSFTMYKNILAANTCTQVNRPDGGQANRWEGNQLNKEENDDYRALQKKITDTVDFRLDATKAPVVSVMKDAEGNVLLPTTFYWEHCGNASKYTVEVLEGDKVVWSGWTTKNVITTDQLAYNKNYTVRVTTREYLGLESQVGTTEFSTGSQQPPAKAPEGFTAEAAVDGILAKWDTGRYNVNVYRSDKTEPIAENISGVGYVDQDVTAGQSYTYTAKLVNEAGDEGPAAESVTVQAPAYETLFEDTFDGDKISDQWKDASGNVPANTATTNGTWVPGGKWKEYYVNNGTTEWTDYVMEADITYNGALAEQESYSGFGPIFRADTTNGNRRFYQLTIKSQTGEIQLAASLDSRNWYHFDLLPGEPIEDGKTYHLRTECSGDVLRIYVDDVLRYETKATAAELQGFVNGGIGIGFGKDKISIDNVWVHAAKEPEKYAITIDPAITNGTVTAKPMEAVAGTEITVTVTPDQGYQLKTGSLKANDEEIVDDKFTMPAEAVTITAEFEKIPQTVDKTELNECVEEAKALREKDYTEESWKKFEAALETAIEIQQDENATQQTVDAAARALKKAMDALEKKDDGIDWPIWVPSVPDEKPSWELPFTDVAVGAWYYESVYYAWQQDLIDGVTADKYQPDGSLTVAQAIKLAAALHEKLNRGYVTLENGTANWYEGPDGHGDHPERVRPHLPRGHGQLQGYQRCGGQRHPRREADRRLCG